MTKLIIPKTKRCDVIIGIDPDVDKSGIAVYNLRERTINASTRDFPHLIEQLLAEQEKARLGQNTMRVYVEAGWLNKSNWHLCYGDTKQIAAAKGNATGRNHEVGRKIIEMCEYYGIDVVPVKPLRKMWKGKDGKITQKELNAITGMQVPRTNQEGRDAALICLVYGK